jgi:hypothetical protein
MLHPSLDSVFSGHRAARAQAEPACPKSANKQTSKLPNVVIPTKKNCLETAFRSGKFNSPELALRAHVFATNVFWEQLR